MHFEYNPQRNNRLRISYEFIPSTNKIIITVTTGLESIEKTNGLYTTIFKPATEEKYFIDFNITKEPTKEELPEGIITIAEKINGESHIKLLKPYGPEEDNLLHITFPSPFEITEDCKEEGKSKTSLNSFEISILSWTKQLSEIKNQIHNLLVILKEEYSKINKIPPASPITIRSLKTAILTNTIMHIETISNLMMEIYKGINRNSKGFPKKMNGAPQPAKIYKKDNHSLGKIEHSLTTIKALTGIHIENPSENTPEIKNFTKLKKIRNNITHIKKPNTDPHSLDSTPASVKITDEDIIQCTESILFFNELLTEAIENTTKQKQELNDLTCARMYLIACEISEKQMNKEIKNKYFKHIPHTLY